ncbi:hypothetical protein MRX96_003058 [Rhipicephalus microplus]
MISRVVVRSGDDDKPQASCASSDGSRAASRKDTGAPKEFRETKHAEVQPRIAEEGTEAEGIGERQRECGCVAWRPAEPRELGDVSELRICCPSVGSAGVSFEQGMEFSDAGYEPRPAAACASGACPVSDQSADAENDTTAESERYLVRMGGAVRWPTQRDFGAATKSS